MRNPLGGFEPAGASGEPRYGSALEHELPGIRIETTIRAAAGLDRVELTSVVENEKDDHRLRVLVRSDSDADSNDSRRTQNTATSIMIAEPIIR